MTEKANQEILNAQETPFVKALQDLAERLGYKIYPVWVGVTKTGFETLNFYTEPKELDGNSYIPEICSRVCRGSFDNKPFFKVATSSYGSLREEEMQKFMEDMNKGLSMQVFLNNIDWSKCPRINVDEN